MATKQAKCANCDAPIEVQLPFDMPSAVAVFATCQACAQQEHFEEGGRVTELASEPEGARFPIGPIVTTPGAAKAMADSRESVIDFVSRHAVGDWGNNGHLDKTKVTDRQMKEGMMITDDVAKLNKVAVDGGAYGRVESEYKTSKGERLWVMTTLGHNETVVLLPEEY